MSSIKEFVDNLTDEQILSSAYMCCQRNAIKAARNNLIEKNNRRIGFSSRQSKKEFKQMHRDTHFTITIKGFIMFYFCFWFFTYIALAIVHYFKPVIGGILLKLYGPFMLCVLVFPIVRKILIELNISKKYKNVKQMYNKSLETDSPIEKISHCSSRIWMNI